MIPEIFHLQGELRSSHSFHYPKVSLFLKASKTCTVTTSVSFTFLLWQLQTLFPPISSPQPHSCMAASWPPFHSASTAHTYLWGPCGFSDGTTDGTQMWKNKISPTGFTAQLHKHLCQSNSESAIKALEAYLSSGTAAKCKTVAAGPPLRRVAVGGSTSTCSPHCYCKDNSAACRAAADLLHITALHVKRNQNQCQFSLIQQTVKLAAVSTAALQAAEPSLGWGSGIHSRHFPRS